MQSKNGAIPRRNCSGNLKSSTHTRACVSKIEKYAKLTREINLTVSQVCNFYTCVSFSVVLQTKLGLGCLTVEVSRSHAFRHTHAW